MHETTHSLVSDIWNGLLLGQEARQLYISFSLTKNGWEIGHFFKQILSKENLFRLLHFETQIFWIKS